MLGSLAQETLVRLAALTFIVTFFYMIPSLVAWNRAHHNLLAITLLNVFLGWTFIGWVAALIWACTNPPPKR